MIDEESNKRLFNHIIQLYVLPEIDRRKELGIFSESFILDKAQIIFYGDRRPIVRLNEETKILAHAKLKDGIKKDRGEMVSHKEIERIENLRLLDEEEPKCAHISLVKFGEDWLVSWDARYNKELARKHFETAKQFCISAQNAYDKNLFAPFVDNLFSCIELLAKSELLLISNKQFVQKTTHDGIQIKYNEFVNIGNAKKDFKNSLNKLRNLRDSARYLKSDLKLFPSDAQRYLSISKEMLDYVENRLKITF
jgi:uncharacterized protein (UPF0332 family)